MTTTQDIYIDGHKLVALSFNPPAYRYQTGPDSPATKTPIIFLHGICSSVYYWQNQDLLATFLPYGPCYALSLPGHYPATVSPTFCQEHITPENFAAILSQAIYKLVGKRPITLIGHSTGGFAALNVAAFYPDQVQHIISIAGFVQGRWQGIFGVGQKSVRSGPVGNLLFKLSMKLAVNIRAMHRITLPLFTANASRFFAYPNLEFSIDTYLPYAKQLDMKTIKKYFAELPNIDISHLLPNITAPTLAIAGDCDPIVPPTQSRLIAERTPLGNLALLPGVGHLPFFENPAEYQRIIAQWFSQQMVLTAQ